MKAAIVSRYGSPDVLQVGEMPKPSPAPGQLLVRVHTASVNRTDCGELRGHPFFIRAFYGLRRPRRAIFGLDFAGTVEAVGDRASAFKPGDRVFGMCPSAGNGSHAEYVAVPEKTAARMPEGLSFEACTVCEGAYYAYGTLKKSGVGAGHRILVYGASGAIGSSMVQLAKSFGAEVTAVVATPQLDMARSLGADRVIDYTAGDFAAIDDRFDYVIDAVGKTTYFHCRRLLKPGGRFVATDLGPKGQNVLLMLGFLLIRSRRVWVAMPGTMSEFMQALPGLLQAGLFRAVIDRRYPLDDIRSAYQYVETGRKVGVVVLRVAAETAGAG